MNKKIDWMSFIIITLLLVGMSTVFFSVYVALLSIVFGVILLLVDMFIDIYN